MLRLRWLARRWTLLPRPGPSDANGASMSCASRAPGALAVAPSALPGVTAAATAPLSDGLARQSSYGTKGGLPAWALGLALAFALDLRQRCASAQWLSKVSNSQENFRSQFPVTADAWHLCDGEGMNAYLVKLLDRQPAHADEAPKNSNRIPRQRACTVFFCPDQPERVGRASEQHDISRMEWAHGFR